MEKRLNIFILIIIAVILINGDLLMGGDLGGENEGGQNGVGLGDGGQGEGGSGCGEGSYCGSNGQCCSCIDPYMSPACSGSTRPNSCNKPKPKQDCKEGEYSYKGICCSCIDPYMSPACSGSTRPNSCKKSKDGCKSSGQERDLSAFNTRSTVSARSSNRNNNIRDNAFANLPQENVNQDPYQEGFSEEIDNNILGIGNNYEGGDGIQYPEEDKYTDIYGVSTTRDNVLELSNIKISDFFRKILEMFK